MSDPLVKCLSTGAFVLQAVIRNMADDPGSAFKPEYLHDLAQSMDAAERGDEIGAWLYLRRWEIPWPGGTEVVDDE